MMTPVQKLAGLAVLILVLMAIAAGITWQVQDWRLGKKLAEQLAEQGSAHQKALHAITGEAWRQQKGEQDKRMATELVTFLTTFYSSSVCFFTIIVHLRTQGREAERLEAGRKFTLDH